MVSDLVADRRWRLVELEIPQLPDGALCILYSKGIREERLYNLKVVGRRRAMYRLVTILIELL